MWRRDGGRATSSVLPVTANVSVQVREGLLLPVLVPMYYVQLQPMSTAAELGALRGPRVFCP